MLPPELSNRGETSASPTSLRTTGATTSSRPTSTESTATTTTTSTSNGSDTSTPNHDGVALVFGISAGLIILLLAAVVGGWLYLFSSNVHYYIFSLFLGTFMYMRDRKRKMRDATLKTDFNPVYATYQDDSEPIAEVFCYFFLLQGF